MKSLKIKNVNAANLLKKNFFNNQTISVTNEPGNENADYNEYLENYRNTTRWQTI